MNPEQVEKLLSTLDAIAKGIAMPNQYTITGAADWQILVTLGGALGTILLAAIAFMWVDLRSVVKDNRGEWKEALDKHKIEADREAGMLWNAMRDCKADCCPSRHRE